HQGLAVGWQLGELCRGDRAIGAGAVLDDDRLTPNLFKLAAEVTRDDIGRSAGRETYEEAHRPRRIGLRANDPRHRRERGSARSQLQECAAEEFHGAPRARGEKEAGAWRGPRVRGGSKLSELSGKLGY